MKKIVFLLIGLAVGGIATGIVFSRSFAEHAARELAQKQSVWDAEKVALETALRDAQNRPTTVRTVVTKQPVETQNSPQEIIAKLVTLRTPQGNSKAPRLIIHQLELLAECKHAALPPIREFLARNEEVDYDSPFSVWRGAKDGKAQTEFILPPSLRFGLLDVVRQLGGADAEKLLADTLKVTGRGAEVGYLARVLQEMVPNKYKDVALSVAHDLLNNPSHIRPNGLDKYDREYLYGVLALYGDTSFAAIAQTQLLRADGVVDRGALKYLQQTVGTQALASVALAYQDPKLDSSKREPLIRYALSFAGVDEQATEMWHAAVNDPSVPFDQRRELIEDLNQDGIQNEKNPTSADAKLIAQRLQIVDRYQNETDNPTLQAAWKEAQKDLRDMLATYAKNPIP